MRDPFSLLTSESNFAIIATLVYTITPHLHQSLRENGFAVKYGIHQQETTMVIHRELCSPTQVQRIHEASLFAGL